MTHSSARRAPYFSWRSFVRWTAALTISSIITQFARKKRASTGKQTVRRKNSVWECKYTHTHTHTHFRKFTKYGTCVSVVAKSKNSSNFCFALFVKTFARNGQRQKSKKRKFQTDCRTHRVRQQASTNKHLPYWTSYPTVSLFALNLHLRGMVYVIVKNWTRNTAQSSTLT